MNPGETISPVASMRSRAVALRNIPAGVIRAILPLRIARSPWNQALPVPSTIRPPLTIVSYGACENAGKQRTRIRIERIIDGTYHTPRCGDDNCLPRAVLLAIKCDFNGERTAPAVTSLTCNSPYAEN